MIPSHFAELFDFLPDVLAWVKDRQGRYLWVNRAFLIQYSLNHPAGKEFAAAVENDNGDARYYYFLGLARLAQGKRDAYEDFDQGARLEELGRPTRAAVPSSVSACSSARPSCSAAAGRCARSFRASWGAPAA